MSIFAYAIFGLVFAMALTGYFHGIHAPVEWRTSICEGFDGVAKTHRGHYKEVMDVIEDVKRSVVSDKLISAEDIKLATTFGVYYDDPNKIKDSK